MKRRKLKGFVLPTLYLLITISIFTGVVMLGRDLTLMGKEYDFGTEILDDNVESVVVEDTIASSTIESPVDTDNVKIGVHYYSKDSDIETQKNSLIYYERTYLPNTGVLYEGDKEFEVKTVFAGKVTDILDDEFFNKVIVVEHTNNIRTYYYGIKDIEVSVGDEITSGTVLGMSQNNAINNEKMTCLFEVYHNNEHIDPEQFIGAKITNFE